MTAGLQADVLVVLRTNFAELESGAHLTVQFILLLRDADVVLLTVTHQETQVRVHVATIRVQETEHSRGSR